MALRKSILCLVTVGLLGCFMPKDSFAYNLSAGTIYQQAKKGNHEYFRLLRRYRLAIDRMDVRGNTAYCLALIEHNEKAANFLAKEGANVHHQCVKQNQRIVKQTEPKSRKMYAERTLRHPEPVKESFSMDDDYLWYGLGILALGGGIAALASGGGGGGHGGAPGWYKHLPLTPEPDSPAQVRPSTPVGTLRDMTADEFRTSEFLKTNGLDEIKAAEAYAHIYKKDEAGNIFSHQQASSNPLEIIKVGVLDTGVYTNRELAGKILKAYDINMFNEENSLWGYMDSDGAETYVFKRGELYYVARYQDKGRWADVGGKSDTEFGLTEDELRNILESWGIDISQMNLMNGGGGRYPGEDTSSLLSDDWTIETFSELYDVAHGASHGTHVAGIIGADKNDKDMHGVAFDNAKFYVASWDFFSKIYPTIKDMVDNGVTVLNHSWGEYIIDPDGTKRSNIDDAEEFFINTHSEMDLMNAYIYAANNNAVWVQATGNQGNEYAGLANGLGRLDLSEYGYSGPGQYEVPYVAVTALDTSKKTSAAPAGQLASWANWCKGANSYCIAAPGTNVVSSMAVKDGVITESGTSMATPVVTGSIALLNGYYPWLSAQNVAWLILETANRSGEYANSDKYGRGALDLEAAVTTPIGGLGLPIATSVNSLVPVQSNRIAGSSVMNGAVKKALPKTITAFDALKRPFEYGTANMVSETHASNANLRHEVARAGMFNKKKQIKDEKTGFQFNTSESLNKGGQAHLASVDVVNETDSGSMRFYYAENSKYETSESVLKPTDNPYFAMNEAYGAENTLNLSETSKLKLSLQTGENGLYGRDYEQDKYDFDERSYAVGAEYSFNLTDYLELATVGGLLYEEDAVLGLNGQGALAFNDGSTYYMGLKAKLNLTPNVALLAAYYRGYTEGQSSALMAISGLETESFMLAGEYQLNTKDKVGLSLSSPLSVRRGHATFKYANGRDNYSDTAYMQKLTSSLRPAAKEYDLGVYYMGEPKEDLNLMGKIEARFNADGEKGVTDYIGIMGAQYAFPK